MEGETMDAKQIGYFLEITHAGSFTAAARKLYISVPGLVKTMDKLEAELGVPLFARMRTGVRLTSAGMALARLAPGYMRQHDLICAEVRKAADESRARVEVGMTWGLLSFFPRNFLSNFVLKNPDVSLTTHNYELSGCRQALLSRRESIGLYFGKLEEPSLDILFHRETSLVSLMSDQHPLAERKNISLEDLRPYRLVILSSDPSMTEALESQLVEAGCAPQIILDGAEWTQAMELIENAGYISFCLPPAKLEDKHLKTIPVSNLDLVVNFNMAILKDVPPSDAEKRFQDYVVNLMNAGHETKEHPSEKRRKSSTSGL